MQLNECFSTHVHTLLASSSSYTKLKGVYKMGTIIKGKEFSDEEIISVGRHINRKITNIFRWIGVGGMGLGAIILLSAFVAVKPEERGTYIVSALFFLIPGIVLFLISFKKRDPFITGKQSLEKKDRMPTNFQGNVADIMQFDKEVILSKKPLSRFLLNTQNKQFQIFDEKHYSKIMNDSDIIEYEIMQDDEVITNSITKTKKGKGRSLAGGLLFGEAGMIAGSIGASSKSRTSETQNVIHHFTLKLRVNDMLKPAYVIKLDSMKVAEEINSILLILTKKD